MTVPPPTDWFASVCARLRDVLDPRRLQSLEQWRERLATYFIYGLVVTMPLGLAAGWRTFREQGHWHVIALDLIVWAWAIVVAVRPCSPWRRYYCALVVYGLQLVFFATMGPSDARPTWLVGVPVMNALLFGARGALGTVAANLAMLLGFYHLLGPELDVWREVYRKPDGWWQLYLATSTLFAAVTSLPVGMLLDGLGVSLRKERELRNLLASEHEDLERAHQALVDEVAERERLEHHLRQSQKLEAMGTLAGGVAHDLNNFLLPITLCTEMVQERLPKGSREHDELGRVLEASEGAKALIGRVLAFSRKAPPPDAYVDLGGLVQELVAQMRTTFAGNLRIAVNLRGGCDPVFSNRAALGQVVTNLINNAVAAMPDGGVLTLSVRPEEVPGEACGWRASGASGAVVLSVQDTGPGMDAETAGRAFEPFFTTKAVGEGTGLGLATVHGIVASLGGRVELQTASGRGSCFSVLLPTRRPPDVPRIHHVDARIEVFRGRALLVDDDDASRTALRRKLESMGVDVETASNVPVALDRLRSDARVFDLLITDSRMPQVSGLELIRHVRARDAELPIMLVTGFPDTALTERARALRVNVLLPKPFGHRDIVCALGATLPRASEPRAAG